MDAVVVGVFVAVAVEVFVAVAVAVEVFVAVGGVEVVKRYTGVPVPAVPPNPLPLPV